MPRREEMVKLVQLGTTPVAEDAIRVWLETVCQPLFNAAAVLRFPAPQYTNLDLLWRHRAVKALSDDNFEAFPKLHWRAETTRPDNSVDRDLDDFVELDMKPIMLDNLGSLPGTFGSWHKHVPRAWAER